MSAGTINEFDAEITEADIALARQINARRNANSVSDYRRALIQRWGMKEDKKPPLSALPGGGYRRYRLIAGRYHRRDLKDVIEAQKATIEQRKDKGPGFPPVEAPIHVFVPGDEVTPENDVDALTLDQDVNKFREIGTADDGESVDALLAENNRLKSLLARQEELDRREREVAEREAAAAKGNKKS